MCVVSMIDDHYNRTIPWDVHVGAPLTITGALSEDSWVTVREVKNLIESYFKDREDAIRIDKNTNQPNCEDPEKAKIVERLERLEKALNSGCKYVTDKDGYQYVIVDGKIYKAV